MSTMHGPSWRSEAGNNRDETSGVIRRHRRRTSPFRFPLGVEMIEGENYRQREGYDVIYLKDEETPRYQYTLAVSSDRAPEVFARMLGLLPQRVRAVLEVPFPEESAREICDVWMSKPIPREILLRAFHKHERLVVHDGMVGFGAISPDGLSELFMDEHKLIYYYAPDMERADAALAELGLPGLSVVRHFSELGHVHVSLSGKGVGEPYWEAAEQMKETLGLDWEESKEYT